MSKFDEMSAGQIQAILEKEKPPLAEAKAFYDHEMNGDMRPEVLAVIKSYIVITFQGSKTPVRPAKAPVQPVKPKKRG